MICSRGGFPKLESLVLNTLDELERWVIEAGAMPRLRRLEITYCRKLAMLPEGLQQMAALKELVLWNMTCYQAALSPLSENYCPATYSHAPLIFFSFTIPHDS
ncbi:unnamed protein product [Spirodela intermedia]|uniref:Uncharacterized protein n=1 Tax=Spirodela intermedia TaxID=51605 RepID=A0A7I8KS69_SPIIN|nr:unnamed protein product [Spirodela intermedia]